jgi:hypothetical protein
MRDLVKLSQRIGQIIPEHKIRIQEIYNYITSDHFCVTALKHLSSTEIIKICFLIYESRRGRSDLSSVLSELENIFLFSTIYFSGERKSTCYDCGGDGHTRCDNCGGSGEIECNTCEGNGNITCPDCDGDGEDSEGEVCGNCKGEGTSDCTDCNGGSTRCEECDDGYINCDDCDGSGEIIDEGLEYTLRLFVSYSEKIKRIVVNCFESTQSLSYKITDDITNNRKTILLADIDSDDYRIDTGWEAKTYINGFKDKDELSYLESATTNRGIRMREDDLEEVNDDFL